ncbi:hypothetical protein AMTR_s00065p00107310, partial [Amborella trichopoda]
GTTGSLFDDLCSLLEWKAGRVVRGVEDWRVVRGVEDWPTRDLNALIGSGPHSAPEAIRPYDSHDLSLMLKSWKESAAKKATVEPLTTTPVITRKSTRSRKSTQPVEATEEEDVPSSSPTPALAPNLPPKPRKPAKRARWAVSSSPSPVLEPLVAQESPARRVTFHPTLAEVDCTVAGEATHTETEVPNTEATPITEAGVDRTEADERSEGMAALLRSDRMPVLSPIRASSSFSHGASTNDLIPRGNDTCSEDTVAAEHLTYLALNTEVASSVEIETAAATPEATLAAAVEIKTFTVTSKAAPLTNGITGAELTIVPYEEAPRVETVLETEPTSVTPEVALGIEAVEGGELAILASEAVPSTEGAIIAETSPASRSLAAPLKSDDVPHWMLLMLWGGV